MKNILTILLIGISFGGIPQTNAQINLNSKQTDLVQIADLTGKGDLKKLPNALNKGLEDGWAIQEINEMLIQVYAYAGFPRSLQGIQTFIKLVDDRKAKGIIDVEGKNTSPISSDSSKYERGKAILEQLTGVKESEPKKGYAAFAPTIEIFLKEHLFADIFERDILNYQERELITISILSSLGNVDPMLQSHLNISSKQGITPAQLKDFAKIITNILGRKSGKHTLKIINEVIKTKK